MRTHVENMSDWDILVGDPASWHPDPPARLLALCLATLKITEPVVAAVEAYAYHGRRTKEAYR
jgi:hypothetical protein